MVNIQKLAQHLLKLYRYIDLPCCANPLFYHLEDGSRDRSAAWCCIVFGCHMRSVCVCWRLEQLTGRMLTVQSARQGCFFLTRVSAVLQLKASGVLPTTFCLPPTLWSFTPLYWVGSRENICFPRQSFSQEIRRESDSACSPSPHTCDFFSSLLLPDCFSSSWPSFT